MVSKFTTGAGLAALALALSATPALAGRCGHSYPVDAPTTLAKVARACNVSLAALKEANAGVDPAYVAPGQHLAVPDEIDTATDIPAGGADLGVDYDSTPAKIYRYAEYTEPAPAPSSETSSAANPDVYQVGYGPNDPYFVRASLGGGYAPFPEDETLSYQKRSAQRIRNAGTPILRSPVGATPLPGAVRGPVMISADSDKLPSLSDGPVSPLMECSVLRRQPNGKIAQVREVKPMAEGRAAPAHCVALRTSAPGAPLGAARWSDDPEVDAFLRKEFENGVPAASAPSHVTVIKGFVSDANAECVTVRADDGMIWRVGVALAPMELLGKEATLWAELADTPQCGGLVASRFVYAEPVN